MAPKKQKRQIYFIQFAEEIQHICVQKYNFLTK